MKKFTIIIEETVLQDFEIEAKNAGEALDIANKNYKKVYSYWNRMKYNLNKWPLPHRITNVPNGMNFSTETIIIVKRQDIGKQTA